MPTAPYQKNSDTSFAAAVSMEDQLAGLEALVFRLVQEAGETGLTNDELVVATGLPIQTVCARRRSLVLKGRLIDSGQRRKTKQGRYAAVHIVGMDASAAKGSLKKNPSRPSAAELRCILKEIKDMVEICRSHGHHPSDLLQDFGRWLIFLASQG